MMQTVIRQPTQYWSHVDTRLHLFQKQCSLLLCIKYPYHFHLPNPNSLHWISRVVNFPRETTTTRQNPTISRYHSYPTGQPLSIKTPPNLNWIRIHHQPLATFLSRCSPFTSSRVTPNTFIIRSPSGWTFCCASVWWSDTPISTSGTISKHFSSPSSAWTWYSSPCGLYSTDIGTNQTSIM